MKLLLCLRRPGVWVGSVLAIMLTAGCASGLFALKHRVLVDAIALPGGVKVAGTSYKLATKGVVATQPVNGQFVSGCLDAALATQGLFAAPANVPPQIFVEISYGRDNAPRVDATQRETYLELSARSNPALNNDHPTGPEIWNVRASIKGVGGHIEDAMPLLSTVAASYAGQDTHTETAVDVPDNSPAVEATRQGGVRGYNERQEAARAAMIAKAAQESGSPAPASPPAASGEVK